MLASTHTVDEAVRVLRVLIVALGGFCTIAAILLALWFLLPLRRERFNGEPRLATLLHGLLFIFCAGLAALTTDHINQHLLANDAPAWQLWSALVTFALGVVTLLSLIAVRVDRKSGS